ncbi:hypothetical protein F3Y22_tig00008013pilonHSYRG00154 [Hibiscus syriacus]|uniref:Uncharacterized protein n=1 Tax=Hibiscus syriacus TaxID=106335 RepID=A0A6A3CFG8_HIBSY|nr:hypothetical protein F3Y22_tig00008013pilonHSYRG00154 [Hibiscus syriacus]
MGTEVLRPQDCLIDRIRVPPMACPRRRYGNGSFIPCSHYCNHNNNNGNGRFNRKSAQRKRVGSEQPISKKYSSADDLKTVRNSVTMDKVTILRRGESLDSKIKSKSLIRIVDIKSSVMGKSDVYAGSAFFVSPAPSSLPLPSFSKKKEVPVDDSATRDLRRLLRLDL